ncbi:hypothetical protein F2P56_028336, partial [Juglans regia]
PPPMPPFPSTFIYPAPKNAEESGRVQQTKQNSTSFEKTASNPLTAETSAFISGSKNIVGGTSLDVETEVEEINEENSDHDKVEEEPKPGMKFATDHELMAYYMRYAKQQGFGVITQRTKREANGRVNKEGCISTYDVLDEITTDDDHVKSIKYTVYFNDEEIDLKCTCALFEMRGIVCRHALNVCQMNKIHALPEKYLLERWRKDLKRRYTVVKSSYDDLRQNADSRRYEFVVKRCVKLATRVSSSDAHVTAFMRHLEEFENQFKGLTLESSSTKVTETVVTDKGKKILSPHVVRGKGRPPTKRKVPPVEKVATKRKKKQTRRKIFDDTNQNCEVSEAPENVE